MSLSTRFTNDLSEILEQIISNKFDNQLANKCKKMNHYLRYIFSDSYYYYMYGSPGEDTAPQNGYKAPIDHYHSNPLPLGSIKHEQPERDVKVTQPRKTLNSRNTHQPDRQTDQGDDDYDVHLEHGEMADTEFDPQYKRSYTRKHTQKESRVSSDGYAHAHAHASGSKKQKELKEQKDKDAKETREIRERELKDSKDKEEKSALKDNSTYSRDTNQKDKDKDSKPSLLEPTKSTRHCFKVKYVVDNDFIRSLADTDLAEINFNLLPYYNTKSPFNTVKFRVERGGDRLCKIYNLSYYQHDYELLLDVVESFYRPCSKKKWLSAEVPYIDEQIKLMRQRLKDQGLDIYAQKARLEHDEMAIVKTQIDDKLENIIPLTRVDVDKDQEEYEDNEDLNESTTNYNSKSNIEYDFHFANGSSSTNGKNYFAKEFYENIKQMSLNDYRLPFSTISKNKSSMQCRIKRASAKIEKKFQYINYSNFYEYIYAYFTKFFYKCIDKDYIQTDMAEYEGMVKWLYFKDKEQRQNNAYENAGYSEEGNLDQINDEMADADSKNDENQESMINTNDE